MKTIKCPDCGGAFSAVSRDEILGILYDHYMKDHHEIITGAHEQEKKVWMERFEKQWSEAKEF